MKKQQLILIHPIDPRGEKVGGIETHIRLILQRYPDDFSVLYINKYRSTRCSVCISVNFSHGFIP